MNKSKGRSHFFKGTDLYYIKSVLDYIRKNNPKLSIPNCWKEGGSLNEKVKTDYGITPSWTNGIEGRGHREKYTGTDMYKIADKLVEDLKAGNIKRHNTLTPIEALASDNKISSEDFIAAFENEFPEPKNNLNIYPMTPKEEIEKAIREAADELVDAFQSFMNKVFEAYKAST